MNVLLRRQPGIQLLDLTPQLCEELGAEADQALNGSGCNLESYEISCFASETCTRRTVIRMKLDHLIGSSIAVVAVATRPPSSFDRIERRRFVGCVSADPHTFKGDVAMLMSNLCVVNEYRKCGIGRRLVREVINRSNDCMLCLRIDKSGLQTPSLRDTFKTRIARLVETYEKLGFVPVEDGCQNSTSMVYGQKPCSNQRVVDGCGNAQVRLQHDLPTAI